MRLSTDYAVSLKKKSQNDPTLAPSWYEGFKKRNPTVALMKPQQLSVARAKATLEEVLTSYFNELESILKKNDLMDRPHLNINETGLMMEHSPTKVLSAKGRKPTA